MKRMLLVLATAILVAGMPAAPVAADVDANPNAGRLVNVSCPDADLFFESVWVAALASVAGHDLDGKVVGAAKSIYATDAEGNRLVEVFDRPGLGLDAITVWCFWQDGESPTGYAGGDILFNARLRP